MSLTSKRRTETTRPIFWSNRQRSYISRTADWDEFPNGRWGDSRSPAYGELQPLSVSLRLGGNDILAKWGTPVQFHDICNVFAKFCRGMIDTLPWSDQPRANETSVISEQLAKINECGFLTINSQPRVDGAHSNHRLYGWGPRNGYVYQKAYLEFFTSPDRLLRLLDEISQDPMVTYHAVNKKGDVLTNATSSEPNAVTWGVFPCAEVIQPTIVEATSFLAWKDEAFELGYEWAKLYESASPATATLLREIMDTHYLVNIVHNDYRHKDEFAIFEPFFNIPHGGRNLKPAVDV